MVSSLISIRMALKMSKAKTLPRLAASGENTSGTLQKLPSLNVNVKNPFIAAAKKGHGQESGLDSTEQTRR